MKVSQAQAEKNRERVVSVASELFRERGFDGIGLNDLMEAAGLTRGGFYGQFASKENLAVEACTHALATNSQTWSSLADPAANNPMANLVGVYLSKAHRDHAKKGCAFAALAPEAARSGPAVRSAFTKGIASHLAVLRKIVPGRSDRAKQQAALAALSQMVGALILARVVDDEALSDGLLDAAAASLTARGDQALAAGDQPAPLSSSFG